MSEEGTNWRLVLFRAKLAVSCCGEFPVVEGFWVELSTKLIDPAGLLSVLVAIILCPGFPGIVLSLLAAVHSSLNVIDPKESLESDIVVLHFPRHQQPGFRALDM
jgi:hypothetical protein